MTTQTFSCMERAAAQGQKWETGDGRVAASHVSVILRHLKHMWNYSLIYWLFCVEKILEVIKIRVVGFFSIMGNYKDVPKGTQEQ